MADFDLKMDLSDLSVEDIASWPWYVRAICIGLSCLAIAVGIFFVDSKRQFKTLSLFQQTELKLKQTFEAKQLQAANLKAYQIQLKVIKKTLGDLLRKLPNETEVPGLLEDISALGHANGLKFTLFKPLPEKQDDFYAKLPITIAIIGSYHQMAQFVSDVSTLDRIVTLDDFTIKDANSNKKVKSARVNKHDKLVIDLTAHTYRYIEKVYK